MAAYLLEYKRCRYINDVLTAEKECRRVILNVGVGINENIQSRRERGPCIIQSGGRNSGIVS